MNYTPQTIRGVTDHIVDDAFIKNATQTNDRILVVQANLKNNSDVFDDATVTLFEKLEELTKDAKNQAGRIDYVDVRIH